MLMQPEVLEELSRDAGIITIRPRAAYVAETESDVIEVIGEARRAGTTVTPRGGGTSIPSQSIGPGFVLLQERRKLKVGEKNGNVRCEPAVIKADLNRELDVGDRWMPVDPSSYRSCTVGGMVANNSSGIRTLKYGSTIEYVDEIRVVLPESGLKVVRPVKVEEALELEGETRQVADLLVENIKEIEEERPRVTKNSCGYRLERVLHDGILDLPKLFVGSEGTLGIITEVSLRTARKQGSKLLLVLESSLADLGRTTSILRTFGPSAIELLDKSVFKQTDREDRLSRYAASEDPYMIFCELDGAVQGEAESALERVSESDIAGLEPRVLLSPDEIKDAWEVRNEILTIAGEIKVGSRVLLPGVEDLVVSPSRLADLVKTLMDQFEGRGLKYISYGHAGDANLHMRPLLDPDSHEERKILDEIMEECFEAVWKMGGSITGEHGDGMLRAKYVERQYPKTHHLMKEIRSIYDPKKILNPGVKIV